MEDSGAGTIFEDAAAALRHGFSRDHMLSRPEKFSEETQLRELERNVGMTEEDGARSAKATSSASGAGASGAQHLPPRHPAAPHGKGNASSATHHEAAQSVRPSQSASGTGASSSAASSSSSSGSAGPASAASTPRSTPTPGIALATSTGGGLPLPRRVEEMSIRQAIWVTMEDPSSSRAAQLVAGLVMGMIILSCAAFVIQTLPEYVEGSQDNVWNAIEDLCITVFTIEFALRFSTCPSKLQFVRQPLNIVDFLAILPFYLELVAGSAAGGSAIIRIIRLVRIFRIFKLSRYLPWVRVFTNALSLSLQPLLMLVLVVIIAMVLFSSVIYYAERGEWSEADKAFMRLNTVTGEFGKSPFQSIPASFWWCIVTMTTGE
jgi:hypothetical protein